MQKLSCSPSLLFTSNGENHFYSEETISEMKLETVDEVHTKPLREKTSDAFHSSHRSPPPPPPGCIKHSKWVFNPSEVQTALLGKELSHCAEH